MIGSFLNQRYRLDREIGHGGLGTIYEALDTLLERPVAVKVLNSDLGAWLARSGSSAGGSSGSGSF